MSIKDRLNDDIDPWNDEHSFEALAIRAEELMRWRDKLLLIDDDEWDDEKDELFSQLEATMLDDFYPWLVGWVRAKQKRLSRHMRGVREAKAKKTKRQQRQELQLREDAMSPNIDRRKRAMSTLGDIWPD